MSSRGFFRNHSGFLLLWPDKEERAASGSGDFGSGGLLLRESDRLLSGLPSRAWSLLFSSSSSWILELDGLPRAFSTGCFISQQHTLISSDRHRNRTGDRTSRNSCIGVADCHISTVILEFQHCGRDETESRSTADLPVATERAGFGCSTPLSSSGRQPWTFHGSDEVGS